MNVLKNVVKEVFKYFLVFFVMLIVFCVCMIITYALPNGSIRKNISESVTVAAETSNNPLFSFYVPGAQLDKYTDLLILNIAINKGTSSNQSVLQRAFENSKYYDNDDQALALKESLADPELYNNSEYSRYWHGIQVIIRPLLMFFNYEEIRYIFYIIMAILLFTSCYLIYRNVGLYQSFAYILALMSICIFMVPSSIQYMGIFTVSIVGLLLVNVLYLNGKEKYYPYLFIIIGGLASFFDLLTTPIITIGIPIIMVTMLKVKKKEKLKDIFICIIWYSALWAVSYALIFVSKWFIASLVLHRDAVTIAVNQLVFRTNGSEDFPATRSGAIRTNLKYLLDNNAFKTLCFAILVIWVIALIKRRKKIKDMKYVLLYAFITLYPYVWYFVIAGHSTIHAWFTHRSQVVTIFATFVALIECLDIPKIKEISGGEKWKK